MLGDRTWALRSRGIRRRTSFCDRKTADSALVGSVRIPSSCSSSFLLYLLLQKPAKKSYERPRTTAFLSRSTVISARGRPLTRLRAPHRSARLSRNEGLSGSFFEQKTPVMPSPYLCEPSPRKIVRFCAETTENEPDSGPFRQRTTASAPPLPPLCSGVSGRGAPLQCCHDRTFFHLVLCIERTVLSV